MIQKFKSNWFLFEELVKRDFTKRYKRTVLGMAWSMISPLANLLIMWAVFNKLLGSSIEHYAVYLFIGQVIFSFFSESTNNGMTSLINNADIFTKVNVPKYLFLFSQNISALINFALTLVIMFLFCGIDGIAFTWKFILLLFPMVCLILFNIGMGLILSAMFVFFRDMQYLWGIASQLIMWLSATFYSIDTFSENIRRLFYFNPLFLYIRYFRKIIIDGEIPQAGFHLLALGYALAVFAIGCLIYKKKNCEFLYYV